MHIPGTGPTTTSKLARRIAGCASNLLATGVILIAALVFGRQVMEWWHGQPPLPTGDHAGSGTSRDPRGENWSHSWLEFGDSPLAMRRIVYRGAAAAVLAELRRGCREAIPSARPSPRLLGITEKQLLERVSQQQPVESEPGRWAIYQLEQPVPIVVAVADEPASQPSETKVVAPERRVISWGLAFPSAVEPQTDMPQWTLFLWANDLQLPGEAKHLDPPIPLNSRRSVTLCSDDGGSVCGVSGKGQPLEWRGFYDRWHSRNGWSAIGSWQELTDTWHRHYEHPSLGAADVQFSRGTDGSMRGLWFHSPHSR